MKYLKKMVYLPVVLLASVSADASEWLINNEQSQLSFISTKKVNIAEVHHFGKLAGGLNEMGQFTLNIDLASVDTGIEIRDQRMREFLFNIAEFPQALLTAEIDTAFVDSLQVSTPVPLTIEAKLNLHGQSQAVMIDTMVTRLSATELLVVATHPVVLNVADYDLVQGVEKLRELAGLPNISHAVPVSFYLTLNASN